MNWDFIEGVPLSTASGGFLEPSNGSPSSSSRTQESLVARHPIFRILLHRQAKIRASI